MSKETQRSSADRVVDAMAGTTMFSYRVVSLRSSNGSCVKYRGVYKTEENNSSFGVIEKLSGPDEQTLTTEHAWAISSRAVKEKLLLAPSLGFIVEKEGSFISDKDLQPDRALHLLTQHLQER